MDMIIRPRYKKSAYGKRSRQEVKELAIKALEYWLYNSTTVQEAANVYGMNIQTLSKYIDKYYKKENKNLTLKSNV